MALTGNTRELSLADLIVVKAQDPGRYRLTLSGPAGDGLILIEGGRIVHAAYGELPPLDAAHVLVTEQNVDFEVEADAEVSGHTLDVGTQELLIEAMRRLDEGLLRRPRRIEIEVAPHRAVREPPRPRSYEARRSPEAEALRRAMGRVLFTDLDTMAPPERNRVPRTLAAIGGVVLLVAGTFLSSRLGWLVSEEHRDPVEITDLDGPRDIVPVLLSGPPPMAPVESPPLLPTILCRLLIDTKGRVREAVIYQPREGFEAFEAAALEAVQGFEFAPARREGVVVPARITWPVDFIPRVDDHEALPVEARFFRPTRDKLPAHLEGEPPRTPVPDRRLRPKIACRVLVGEDGRVLDAEILNSRQDLELYERVALDTVKTYRFTPGEREGVRVPAWVNWTVEFR